MLVVRTAVAAATTAYGANLALGLSVAVRLVDTSGARWVHHGLYVITAVTTGIAVILSASLLSPAALALAPAAVPLLLLQRHGASPLRRHARTALLAAPCYTAALMLTRR